MVARKPSAGRRNRQVNFRVSADVWEHLTAMAAVLGQSQSQLVATAVLAYYDALPSAQRRVVDDAIQLRRRRGES